jgi:DNA polymerase-3 subunit alpha (Gram-positive type)
VDIYKSHPSRFQPENGGLRPPFTAIPGLGLAAAEDVAREREKGAFISVDEFAARCRVSSTLIEAMRELGAFGGLAESAQLSLF